MTGQGKNMLFNNECKEWDCHSPPVQGSNKCQCHISEEEKKKLIKNKLN